MSVTAAELAQLRTDAEVWLMDTCTIQTLTQTTDALGGVVVSYANTYTDILCRIDPVSASTTAEVVRNSALESVSYYQISLKHDQPIGANNRVVHNGTTYEVIRMIGNNSLVTLTRAILAVVE